MHQTVIEQEVKRPIYGRWCCAATVLLAEHCQNVISAQRLVALPYQLKHPAAQGSQAQTLLRTQDVRFAKRAVDTMGVVMGTTG